MNISLEGNNFIPVVFKTQRELFSNCHTSAVKIRPLIATFSYLFVSGFIEHEFQIGKMITITFSQQRGRENTFQRVIQITFQNRLLLKTSKQVGKLSNIFSFLLYSSFPFCVATIVAIPGRKLSCARFPSLANDFCLHAPFPVQILTFRALSTLDFLNSLRSRYF